MSADDICICQYCEKRMHVEERKYLNTLRQIDPADISRITISQLRDSDFYDNRPHVTNDSLFNRFLPIDSGNGRTQQANPDEDSTQRTTLKDQDIENISYWLPGNKSYRAMYDYTAQDTDEVSFSKGDIIINCRSIDKDWMTGVVQRTGIYGMFPASSVQPLKVNL